MKPIRLDGDDLALVVAALRDQAHAHRRRRETAKRLVFLAQLFEDADLITVPALLPLFVFARHRRTR